MKLHDVLLNDVSHTGLMQTKVPPLLQLKADKFREKLYHTKTELPDILTKIFVCLEYVN
jgi:hypothetical protein